MLKLSKVQMTVMLLHLMIVDVLKRNKDVVLLVSSVMVCYTCLTPASVLWLWHAMCQLCQ